MNVSDHTTRVFDSDLIKLTQLVAQMGGFAHRMPGMAVFFVIAGLSSLGLPGLAGFVAEFGG
jgi:NADH:ubiquinone oxidoreductase subunit 4 (subunit M)